MALDLIQPGYYKDLYDGRPLVVFRGTDPETGSDILCVTKGISPKDCLRPSVRDDPKFQPTPTHPLRFMAEVQDHSCHGVYWHVDLPLDGGLIALSGSSGTDTLTIDGKVSDPGIVEGVVYIHPALQKLIEDEVLPSQGQNMTAEAYILNHGVPLCPRTYRIVLEDPFTHVYVFRLNHQVLLKKRKSCGHASSNDEALMRNPIISAQFEEKRADLRRIYYPDLYDLNISKVPFLPEEEPDSPQDALVHILRLLTGPSN